MFEIKLTEEAIEDLRWFKKTEQAYILDELEAAVSKEPAAETRNRKRLRPNQLAEWEVRIGDFRVFYDIDQESKLIKIQAAGYKERNKLLIRGKEYKL
jgi:mRNA-degrading endonuclease RelE of RelBE toxin-antitoxin system